VDYKTILPQIDACRPGSDDANDAELADLAAHLADDAGCRQLYHRVQEMDARLSAQFCAVPVPAGLEDRLLAAAAAATQSPEGTGADSATLPGLSDPSLETAAAQPGDGRARRRRWLRYTGALAATAAAAVVLGVFLQPDRPTADEALAQARAVEVDYGQSAPGGLPASKGLNRAVRVAAQGVAKDFLGQKAAAYDLRLGRLRGTLVVARGMLAELPDSPPATPAATTGGLAVAGWQEGNLVYILLVKGGQAEYRRFVDRGRPSVA
jgi:hypothetical protein